MIGIGVDLVEVDRIRTVLARTPTLAARCFTEGERAYAEAANDPAERFAARFAAKEAVMKAMGVGLGAIDWHDVEVVRNAEGAPRLVVSGRAAALAGELGVTRWLLTLTHTETMAEAIAVALSSDPWVRPDRGSGRPGSRWRRGRRARRAGGSERRSPPRQRRRGRGRR